MMYQYFGINIIISLLTFLYIAQLKSAPSRVSFRFVFIALLSWMIPYDVINTYFSSSVYTPLLPALDEFRTNVKTTLSSQISEDAQLTLRQILLVLSGLGIFVFIKDVLILKRYTKSLNAKFYKNYGAVAVFTSDSLDNAFCTGIIKPKVYINSRLVSSPEFESVLQHELQHIKQHDNFYIAIISFIHRILWWNPLQLMLTQKARAFLELSCDEETAQTIGKEHYQKDLAILLLNKNDADNCSLTLSFFGNKNINILRIQQLNKTIYMNKKHKSLIFSTALIPFIISLFISTQSVSSTVNKEGEIEIATNLKPNQVQIILDSHIFYNFEYTNELDKDGNKIISSQDHRSIETNIISSLNETRKFNFGKEKEEVKITVSQVDKEKFMLDFDITYFIDGKKIHLTPSLLVLNGEPASLITNENNYKFELYIRVIK